jgi:N-acetylglucosaminyldiphosphoundecaprenol N-acetyl-beta-D-mannosaminyltransferase
MQPQRVPLFGIQIDPLRMPEAVERVMGWIHSDEPPVHRYVVTPNADHAVMLQSNPDFLAAYDHAGLVLADGMPVVIASRILRRALPERVTGADLVPALFAAATAQRPLTVYLLGAGPGVAERAAANVHTRWPHVRVVGTYSPPFGFEKDDAETAAILRRIDAARPDLLVVGLGAPKQELWVAQHRERIAAKVSLCVGATIDFLAGEVRRAPRWMQRVGLEWLFRLLCEPRRLFKRYAKDACVFPRLVWREWWRKRAAPVILIPAESSGCPPGRSKSAAARQAGRSHETAA